MAAERSGSMSQSAAATTRASPRSHDKHLRGYLIELQNFARRNSLGWWLHSEKCGLEAGISSDLGEEIATFTVKDAQLTHRRLTQATQVGAQQILDAREPFKGADSAYQLYMTIR